MCGIFGFAGSPDRQLLGRMAAAIVHRGPDDAGAFETPSVSLGHRRLSIIDREGGHQPVANEDETVWLVYNGEVYNYRELRAELEAAGHTFRTHCDSEVIVHAYEEWGAACAARFNGMWAFAIADLRGAGEDGRGGKLVLNRDHFGIKPLYYARSPQTGRLLFASEIKALLQDPELVAEPDEQMIFEYLQHGFHDHRAETFFTGVYHVPSATWIELPLGETAAAGTLTAPLESTAYWTPVLSTDGGDDPADFRRRFRDSVERRLVSEVPVGSCLSGGLDSTTIISFMSELLKEDAPDAASLRGQLKTFSAVFDGDPIDEREYIETAVESTGADTTYTNPTSHEFIGELRDFVWHQEEPIVSTGPYAQWCVMRSAREQVTVLLDGQGGDELIAGYVPYQLVYLRQLRKERKYDVLRREATASRDVLMPLAKRRIKQRRKQLPTSKLLRRDFLARTTDPGYGRSQSELKERLLQDLLTYSLPCLLRYEDRNSMAFSIESRVPYLDQEFVDHILSLPEDAIVRHGWSRWILRAALKGTLPEKIRLRRWKVGFTTPEMRWIKARRAAFTSLYQSPTFQARPYWDGEAVVSAFRACCRGEVEESMFFWRAANIELWLREFVDVSVVLEGADVEAALSAPVPVGPVHRGSIAEAGDARVPALLAAAAGPQGPAAAAEAERLLAGYAPNEEKHLFGVAGRTVFARLPLQDRPRRPRRRPGRPPAPPDRGARPAGRPRRHGREAHRRQPGPQLRARRDPPHEAGQGPQQGRDQDAARHRPRHPRDHAARHRRGRRAAHRRRGRHLRGRQAGRQARPLLQGRRRQCGGHRRPHLEHAAAAQHPRQARSGRSGRRRGAPRRPPERRRRRPRRVRRHRRQRPHGDRARRLAGRRPRPRQAPHARQPAGAGPRADAGLRPAPARPSALGQLADLRARSA